ncbi:MAG: hypothetical protein WAZ94_05035, partial [Phycisphaerales bacterium]
MRRNSMPHARGWFKALVVLLAGAPAALSHAQSVDPRFHVSWGMQVANGYSIPVPADAGIQRDLVLFPGTWFGRYPAQGPHMIELAPEGKEALYADHFERIAREIAYRIPDENWDGYAAIDWELWAPNWWMHENVPSHGAWDAEDRDFLNDWRDYIRQHRAELLEGLTLEEQEAVFARTWNEAGREFFERTVRECKRLRPNTKWGFYNLPGNQYLMWISNQPVHTSRRAICDDKWEEELGWMRDCVDVFYPCYYYPYKGVPGTPHYSALEIELSTQREFIRRSSEQFMRFAQGKLVVPWVCHRYNIPQQNFPHVWTSGDGENNDLDNMFRETALSGVQGLVIWGSVSASTFAADSQFFTSHLFPSTQQLHLELNPPPPPPPPGGDTGGGSGGDTGGGSGGDTGGGSGGDTGG